MRHQSQKNRYLKKKKSFYSIKFEVLMAPSSGKRKTLQFGRYAQLFWRSLLPPSSKIGQQLPLKQLLQYYVISHLQ
jgi:hypothetical protein